MTELQALWWPAIVAFALGGVGGLLLVTTLPPRRSGQQAQPREGAEASDVAAELAFVVQALRALEEQQDKVEKQFYASEKQRLEAEAVVLLKRQQAFGTAKAAATTPAPGRAPSPSRPGTALVSYLQARPILQRAAWGLLLLATGGVLARNLQDAAHAELASEPAAMGAAPMGGVEAVSREELATLKGRLEQNPRDVEALLRVAHLALRAQQFDEAKLFNDRALSLSPEVPEGRVHSAMLMAKDGEVGPAMAALVAVTKDHPGLAEAWFFRGMPGMQQGDMDTMREAFTQFLQLAPDGAQKERVRAMLARSKT